MFIHFLQDLVACNLCIVQTVNLLEAVVLVVEGVDTLVSAISAVAAVDALKAVITSQRPLGNHTAL